MGRIIEVEIDDAGVIRPVDPATELPKGRALLSLRFPGEACAPMLDGTSFADWFTPKEDAAWAYLQKDYLSPAGSAT